MRAGIIAILFFFTFVLASDVSLSDVKVHVEVTALFTGLDAPRVTVDAQRADRGSLWTYLNSDPPTVPIRWLEVGATARTFEFDGVLPGNHSLTVVVAGLRERIVCAFETGGPLYGRVSNCTDAIVEELEYDDQLESKTWQEVFDNYERMCSNILQHGSSNSRFLIFSPQPYGLGNRLLEMTHQVLLAILSERVFLVDWTSPIPLEPMLYSRRYDWDYGRAVTKYPWIAENQKVIGFYNSTDGEEEAAPIESLINAIFRNFPSYRMRGLTTTVDLKYLLQHVPVVFPFLRDPFDGFYVTGLLFNRFFKLGASAQRRVAEHLPTFKENYVISIQIRFDRLLGNMSIADFFVNCALNLKSKIAGRPVRFFLTGDAPFIKNNVKAKLGDSVFSLDEPIVHSGVVKEDHSMIHSLSYHQNVQADVYRGIETALVDMWLMSLCADAVVTETSTFGLMAVSRRNIIPISICSTETACSRRIWDVIGFVCHRCKNPEKDDNDSEIINPEDLVFEGESYSMDNLEKLNKAPLSDIERLEQMVAQLGLEVSNLKSELKATRLETGKIREEMEKMKKHLK